MWITFCRIGHENRPTPFVEVILSGLDGVCQHHIEEGADREQAIAMLGAMRPCSAEYFRKAVEALFSREDAVYGSLNVFLNLCAPDWETKRRVVLSIVEVICCTVNGQGGCVQQQEERRSLGPLMTDVEIAAVVQRALEAPYKK